MNIKLIMYFIGLAGVGLTIAAISMNIHWNIIGTMVIVFFVLKIVSNKKKVETYTFNFKNWFVVFFISVGTIFFLCKLYVLSIYCVTTVVYYRFLVNFFPILNKEKLVMEHTKIDHTTYDQLDFTYGQLFLLIWIILIGVIYNTIFSKFYLAIFVLLSILKIWGLKTSQMFPWIIRKFKMVKKDSLTISYHWAQDFTLFLNIVYISIISLSLFICLLTVLPLFVSISDKVAQFNFNVWCIILFTHSLFVFLVDSYIIFFANDEVRGKFFMFCQKCIGVTTTVSYCNYQLVNNGVTHSNPLFDKTRDFMGLPRAVDKDQLAQYRMAKKFLPHISEDVYTRPTFGVKNSTEMSTPEFIKMAQQNQSFLREVCTKEELKVFRLNLPK